MKEKNVRLPEPTLGEQLVFVCWKTDVGGWGFGCNRPKSYYLFRKDQDWRIGWFSEATSCHDLLFGIKRCESMLSCILRKVSQRSKKEQEARPQCRSFRALLILQPSSFRKAVHHPFCCWSVSSSVHLHWSPKSTKWVRTRNGSAIGLKLISQFVQEWGLSSVSLLSCVWRKSCTQDADHKSLIIYKVLFVYARLIWSDVELVDDWDSAAAFQRAIHSDAEVFNIQVLTVAFNRNNRSLGTVIYSLTERGMKCGVSLEKTFSWWVSIWNEPQEGFTILGFSMVEELLRYCVIYLVTQLIGQYPANDSIIKVSIKK